MREQENITELEQYIIDFVRELRAAKGVSQRDLANAIHVSQGFIGDVESPKQSAKYNLRHLNALADYFNLSPKDFMPGKPFPVDDPSAKKKAPVKAAVKSPRPMAKKSSTKKTATKATKPKAK